MFDSKEYYYKNKERIRQKQNEYFKQYYLKNKEKILDYIKKHAKKYVKKIKPFKKPTKKIIECDRNLIISF